MQKGSFWEEFFSKTFLICFGFIYVLVIVSILTMYGHCESANNNILPYYINQHNSTLNSFLEDNNISVNDIVNGAINGINGNHAYFGSPDTSKCLVFISDYSSGFNRIYFWLLFNPRYESSFNDTSYNNYNYDTLQLKCDVAVYRVTFSTQTFSSTEMKKQTGSSYNMFGSINTVTTNYGTYTPNYPVGMVGLDELKDNSGNGNYIIVSNLTPNAPIVSGNATPPYFTGHSHGFNNSNYPNGTNQPQNVPPQITINHYTWTTATPPTTDLTTIENAINSLITTTNYLFGWLSNNLKGEFENLIDNIGSLVHYIGETIQYYGDLIIQNIQGLAQNIYENFVSLFEPIANNISYIIQPLDINVIENGVISSSIYTDLNGFSTQFVNFKSVFDNTSEPNSYMIPLHLENITILHSTQQNIDLGVIMDNNSLKTLIRGFCWTITTFSLFLTVLDAIPNYVNGGGDE